MVWLPSLWVDISTRSPGRLVSEYLNPLRYSGSRLSMISDITLPQHRVHVRRLHAYIFQRQLNDLLVLRHMLAVWKVYRSTHVTIRLPLMRSSKKSDTPSTVIPVSLHNMAAVASINDARKYNICEGSSLSRRLVEKLPSLISLPATELCSTDLKRDMFSLQWLCT